MPHRSFRTGRGYEIQWQSFWESTAIRIILVSNLYFLCEVASSCQIFLLKRNLSLIYTGHSRRVDAVEIFHKTNIVVPEAVLRQIHNPSPTSCRMIISVSVAWTIAETVSGLKRKLVKLHPPVQMKPQNWRCLQRITASQLSSGVSRWDAVSFKIYEPKWAACKQTPQSLVICIMSFVAYMTCGLLGLWPWQAHQC